MNLKIKFRESFRPFAPVVLRERASAIYDENLESPYMLLVSHVKEAFKDQFPAVTHVDGSARLQTVTKEVHPLLYELIHQFDNKTGCPLLINTSFNVRGEPIVCSPMDALRCFIQTDMDSLFIGPFYLKKENQTADRKAFPWRIHYELD